MKSNYFMRHWHGDLSLGLSYWVNLVLLTMVITGFVAAAGEANILAGMGYYQTAVLFAACCSALALITMWQIVGTWRSSSRHTSRGGLKFWAIAAKILLVMAVLRGGMEYFSNVIPTALNLWRHAEFMSEIAPSEFNTLRGGTEIELLGGIHPGTAARLEVLLTQNSRAKVLHLGSVGGDVEEGHNIASIIRRRGLETYIRTSCVSACATAFLAGHNRIIKNGARLGFHAPTPTSVGLRREQDIVLERSRLASAGMPDWFVERAFAVSGDAMWFPTIEELRAARAITSNTDGRHLSPGRPKPSLTSDAVESELRNNIVGIALERVEPAVFRQIVEESLGLKNDGGTEDDIYSNVFQRRVMPIYTRSSAALPNRQMVATFRTIIETARQIGDSDPRVCRDWLMQEAGRPIPSISPHISREQMAALDRTVADTITTAADPRQRATAPREEPPQLNLVFQRLEARLPREQMLIYDSLNSPSHPPNAVCSLVIQLYTEILRLPEREAGPLLRFLVSTP